MDTQKKAQEALKDAESLWGVEAEWAAVEWLKVIAYLILHYIASRGMWRD